MKSIYNLVKTSVSDILKPYISNKIPESQTNVFYMLFSGIDHTFTHLEHLLRSHKRERNILTAQHIASLRTHAASNGFEPVLKIPSNGLVSLQVNQKLYSRVGYPIYVPPYATFTNITSGVSYYYDSNKTEKLTSLNNIIKLVEGEIATFTHQSMGDELERIYVESNAIANNSITITVNNIQYKQVKSFIDDSNIDKCFIVKFSERPSSPIVIYVKGTKQDDTIQIIHRSTHGESGNINYDTVFETQALLDSSGKQITLGDDDIIISNIAGFSFGSNGTDKNTLKSAIGFNHGISLLFDTISYTSFITQYSTIMLQNIVLENPLHKSINTIYVGRKNHLTSKDIILVEQYKSIINQRLYLLSNDEINDLGSMIEENEFALSSHILKNLKVTKYAFQLVFRNKTEESNHSDNIKILLYSAFASFLNNTSITVNVELLFNTYMNDNNIMFDYDIFNSDIEESKLLNNDNSTIVSTISDNVSKTTKGLVTSYIIKHENTLPIIKGDFPIKTDSGSVDLFFDINTVIKL